MKKIIEFLKKSGVSDEVIYIKKIIPKNKRIFIFAFFLPVSLLIFFVLILIGYFYFFFYFFLYFIKKYLNNKKYTLKYNNKNNFNSTPIYLLREILIENTKSKSYLIFYNVCKTLNLKFDKKTKNKDEFKIKLISYIFKRLFYIVTNIPFLVVKINCMVFEEFEKVKKWKSESFMSTLDNFLFNFYLKNIKYQLDSIKNYKIYIENNSVKFNPSKLDKYFLKGFEELVKSKKEIENFAEFRWLNSKNNKNMDVKHFCKIIDIFKNNDKIKEKLIINETKSSKLYDKYNNLIIGELKNNGSFKNDIITFKMGPIITKNNSGILTRIPIDLLKNVNCSGFEWFFSNDLFYNKKIIYLNKDGLLEKSKDITLSDYYKTNYDKLRDEMKNYIDVKNNFDLNNSIFKKTINEEQFNLYLKEDYAKYMEDENDFFDYFSEDVNDLD